MAGVYPAGQLAWLPAENNEFVGRTAELRHIDGLLRGTRLVTLIGPGGVGKTRIALRAAAAAAARYPDGVCLVELSALRDPALLPHTVARGSSSPSTPATRSATRCSLICATAACCSSSTPASTSSTPARSLPRRSSSRRRTSPCSPPAASRSTWTARPPSPSARSRCPGPRGTATTPPPFGLTGPRARRPRQRRADLSRRRRGRALRAAGRRRGARVRGDRREPRRRDPPLPAARRHAARHRARRRPAAHAAARGARRRGSAAGCRC